MDRKQLFEQIRIEDGRRMTKRDYLLLLLLLAVYSVIAFVNLGSLNTPQTPYKAEVDDRVILDLGAETETDEIRFYGNIGEGTVKLYDESAFIDGYFIPGQTEPLATFEQQYGDMFKWKSQPFATTTRYIILYVDRGDVSLNELAVFCGGEQLSVTIYAPQNGSEKLADEQDKVTRAPSYLDGMYFDEIYHARTAYEMVENDDMAIRYGVEYAAENGYSIYEWTHPSLGKMLIAVGIRLFGMTPFGWRFSGTLFGVFILAVLYVFGKRIFRRTDYAFVTTGLFAADCMHFAQTRIATIDVYALFFTLLMFLFMFDYVSENFESRPFRKKLVSLGLCGVSFGLGASSKWTCFYSGAGLAVLYFGDLIYNLVRILNAREDTDKASRKKLPVNVFAFLPVVYALGTVVIYVAARMATGVPSKLSALQWYELLEQKWVYVPTLVLSGAAIVSAVLFRLTYKKRTDVDLTLNNLLMTPVWCCLFFLLIPAALYFVTNYCYYIDKNCTTLSEQIAELWRMQESMYRYHSGLDATHQCQSMWYQWPLAQKSVWFYSGYPEIGNVRLLSNISSTGNPAVWYVSAFGAVFALIEWVKNPACRKDRAFIVALVGILAGLLPWALVTRCVFLYHYFSTLPFVMLMTMLLLYYVEQKYPRTRKLKWIWLAVAAVEFLLMYPAVSGLPVTYEYAKFIENVLAVFGKVYYVGV